MAMHITEQQSFPGTKKKKTNQIFGVIFTSERIN